MQMPQRLCRILYHRFPALAWTLFIFILLVLPGKMLPNEKHFIIPQLDKMVHIILFGGFVFLWSFYFSKKELKETLNGKFLRITFIACLYGSAMEVIQKYFIPNRDFDIYDIAADVAGAIAGYIVVKLIVSGMVKSNQ
jgi:VanZ family protein